MKAYIGSKIILAEPMDDQKKYLKANNGKNFHFIEMNRVPNDGSFGFGVSFLHKGDICGVTVILKKNSTVKDFKKALRELAKACADPDNNPNVVHNNGILTGKEIVV